MGSEQLENCDVSWARNLSLQIFVAYATKICIVTLSGSRVEGVMGRDSFLSHSVGAALSSDAGS
jgi:hypothetical protein